jgi:hypothetical protein
MRDRVYELLRARSASSAVFRRLNIRTSLDYRWYPTIVRSQERD